MSETRSSYIDLNAVQTKNRSNLEVFQLSSLQSTRNTGMRSCPNRLIYKCYCKKLLKFHKILICQTHGQILLWILEAMFLYGSKCWQSCTKNVYLHLSKRQHEYINTCTYKFKDLTICQPRSKIF